MNNLHPNILKRIASLQLQGKNDHQQGMLKIMAGDAEMTSLWSIPLTEQERQDRNNAIFSQWQSGGKGQMNVKIADIPACSVCGSSPALLTFYRGKFYCLLCLVTEYPRLRQDIFNQLLLNTRR